MGVFYIGLIPLLVYGSVFRIDAIYLNLDDLAHCLIVNGNFFARCGRCRNGLVGERIENSLFVGKHLRNVLIDGVLAQQVVYKHIARLTHLV